MRAERWSVYNRAVRDELTRRWQNNLHLRLILHFEQANVVVWLAIIPWNKSIFTVKQDHVLGQGLITDGTEMCSLNLRKSLRELLDKKQAEIYRNVSKRFRRIGGDKKRFPKVMRRVGGHNLMNFIHGPLESGEADNRSEGTLAATLDLKLNLEPLPNSNCRVVFI
jgi:hypothetical protein